MSDFNLFIYKIFYSSDLIQFHLYLIFFKKKVIYANCIKRICYKISIWQLKLFYLFLQKNK